MATRPKRNDILSMTADCPEACSNHRKAMDKDIDSLFKMAIPPWVRAILIGICAAGFVTLFGLAWTEGKYNTATYATKAEVQALREDLRQGQQEIINEIRRLRQSEGR